MEIREAEKVASAALLDVAESIQHMSKCFFRIRLLPLVLLQQVLVP